MALKRNLTPEEKYGLTEEEVKLATRYLRKHKTAGALDELDAAKLFEMFLLGDTLTKVNQQFPQYELGQITLTAALRKWPKDREKMLTTLQDRVKAKVVKSVLEQVDFLTAMLSVSNAEHLSDMVKFAQDPANNPKPDLRIESIKEYKDVVETLHKIVAGATSGGSKSQPKSPMFDALTPKQKLNPAARDEEEDDISIIDAVEDI